MEEVSRGDQFVMEINGNTFWGYISKIYKTKVDFNFNKSTSQMTSGQWEITLEALQAGLVTGKVKRLA